MSVKRSCLPSSRGATESTRSVRVGADCCRWGEEPDFFVPMPDACHEAVYILKRRLGKRGVADGIENGYGRFALRLVKSRSGRRRHDRCGKGRG